MNRSTAEEASQQAFRTAIVPTARLFAEHITRDAIHKKLGWPDLEFVFTDVDGDNTHMFRPPRGNDNFDAFLKHMAA